MALVVKDRVQETSTTTGTGTFTLAGAVSGFQSFSAIGNANTTYYAIVGSTEWEVGLGTYTSSGTTLSRDTILESSNGGTAVNFSAGTKNVFVTYPAEQGIYKDASGNAIALGTPASVTLTNGTGLPIVAGTTGTLTVARGGTGAATLTGVIKGNGTSAFTAATAGTDYSAGTSALTTGIIKSTTTTGALSIAVAADFPTLNQNTSGSAASLSATLVATSGGTGQSTYAIGDLLQGGATNTLTKLAAVATGNALISGGVGVASSYGKIGLTTHVSGILGAANGGTENGFTAFTGPTTSTKTFTLPDASSTIVVQGGALGTPSSGTLTSCTFPTLNQNTTGSAATVTGNATGSTFGFNSGYGSVVTAYGCRAWVNFNGTGTVAIRGSGNVTSITDNGTGDYTVNFTTAITDVNYAVTGMARSTSSTGYLIYGNNTSGNATGSVRITTSSTGAFADSDTISISIFR
jgi:hypothetical protein